jgi:hypothetical protein
MFFHIHPSLYFPSTPHLPWSAPKDRIRLCPLHIPLLLDHWMVQPIHTYIFSQVPEPEHIKADRTKRNKKLYIECVLTGSFLECASATVFIYVTFHWSGYLIYETIG